MNITDTMLALSLTLLAIPAAAQPGSVAASPAETGALPVPANRIVGLWSTRVTVGPCQGGPTVSFDGASVFHAGGTLAETNTSPASSRGHSQGIWKYLGRNQYRTRFQFFAYLPDGSYDGIREITTTTVLNARATQYDATVVARFYNPDGSLRVQLCGNTRGDRIGFD